MSSYHERFQVETSSKPEFYDVTSKVKDIIARSQIENGIVIVYSQHTTCSIIIQEDAHDETYDGTKFIHQDLLDIFECLIPSCRRERQYLHPGPKHIRYTTGELGELPTWSLNTDAHLRSLLLGRSESIPLVNGQLMLGEFGLIYFVDLDGVRNRTRWVHVQIVG